MSNSQGIALDKESPRASSDGGERPGLGWVEAVAHPELRQLCDAAADIQADLAAIRARRAPWIRFVARESYRRCDTTPQRERVSRLHTQVGDDSSLKVFGLWMSGRPLYPNADLCMRTTAVLEQVRPLAAGFACLEPGACIAPRNNGDTLLHKAQLGLVIPDGDCALRVGGVTRRWRVGEVLVFADDCLHEAWNYTSEPRFILILDLPKPGMPLDFARRPR